MSPLINVIRGQEVPHAPLNVRTPVVRVPLWASVGWWLLRGLGRLGVAYVRFWPVTVPLSVLVGVYVAFGWVGPVVLVLAVAGVGAGWWFGHRLSFQRLVWWPVLSRLRRWQVARVWAAAMVTAGLSVSFDERTVLPVLRRVRSRGAVDVLTVRMVSGQIPEDFGRVGDRLAHTFGVRQVKVNPGRRVELVVLTLMRGEPLAQVVAALPVSPVPDLAALPVGRHEDGSVYRLRLAGTHLLVAGATGAGKASVIWSVVRSVAGGIRVGLVQLWGIDPKGGMELGLGGSLFDRLACEDFDAMATLLEEAAGETRARAARLRGRVRQFVASPGDPVLVLVVDELATLTAYADRKVKDRVRAALGLVLSQGRAVGVHVVACLQDPRKETLPFRDLFPTRIALRLTEASHVDMVLGEGVRDRGALCDRIPQSLPGVGYVVLDGDPTPARVRFSYHSDDDVRELAVAYGRPHLRVIGGESDSVEGRAA